MTARASSTEARVALACGEDEFSVKQRAQQILQAWREEGGSFDEEIIDAQAGSSSEALSALNRLDEALNTLPFFGQRKIIWFRNCNFLGEERAASAAAVTERLNRMAAMLKRFDFSQVSLLVSAGKADKRKTFYRSLEAIGRVEIEDGWAEAEDWAGRAARAARGWLRELGAEIEDEALERLVESVGPNPRALHGELEKLAVFAGPNRAIDAEMVARLATRNKQSRAFELAEAVGSRNLPRVMRALDEQLWELKSSAQGSEIGILYGIVSKIRTLIFLQEMLARGWIKPERAYPRFKAQFERLPPGIFAADRRFNPRLMSPYPFFKALDQAANFTKEELIEAMAALLRCNERLIFSEVDPAIVLQQTLAQIVLGNKN